ncbi:DUF485 domain-containing protein [Xenorhabdus nematophila]|uniref:Inner membrane protein yjcH n=1 Tax=Xenorhabdus nematophila (strain ATCC 19061 / DSM 3370 / CCUG 14189 / LMG 1036 / NCIMB 9965 / AN6) TaxID=406817 RepID=D3VG49_XENNA|nr:DUF485 domain-containing protein [Xenorhabdus nematophila]CEE91201.1 Inner membrane protein yjcH [Xenorhabdus nematophila str. Anatoliense]CEF29380.1 Inner membrane protein yjcH [Xenorhabdus nematophila str. Websteri]AYA41639.1 DUF485 domain-containing protein [Xenorhabdus nematophila]KHD28991.1 membrane protein [Xenorhabdus nematophila]MBA0020377.1 DUF485 domain-containing protein [Xenorhabdus nematophila]
MNADIYQDIENNPRFKELVKKRGRFAWLLSIIMLVLYVGFIFLIAFAPEWLGTQLHENTSITRGIPVGVGIIFSSFILTGIYVVKANGEFDRLVSTILDEVRK